MLRDVSSRANGAFTPISTIFVSRSTLPSNPTSQSEVETVDNRVQVLKSVPVNLSLNTEHQETKREQFSSSTGAGAPSGDGGSPAVAVVKAEMYAPVFMAGSGLHYRVDGEESARVIYEQSPYEVTTVSHSSYVKEDQQSPPDSPFEEERDGVRKDVMVHADTVLKYTLNTP